MSGNRHIHAERCGDGHGPRLVLLHGWTMAGAVMAPLAQALSSRFASVAPDLPGHGRTTGYGADMQGAVAMLDDLLADGAPTVLVGWSLGALVGWDWLQHSGPGAVRGMVSLDMSPCPLPVADWAFGMSGQDAARIRTRASWFRSGWDTAILPLARGMFADPPPPGAVDHAARVIAAQDGAVMAGFWSSLVEVDCRAAIGGLSVPLLAIHGAQSRVYPPGCAGWLADTAPAGFARVIDGAGHAPHLERLNETAEAIAHFAERMFAA